MQKQSSLVPKTDDQSSAQIVLMCQQLSEQYPRAVAAMVEILKFGAMMMRFREIVSSKLEETMTQVPRAQRGPSAKGRGFETLIPKEIKIATAYRFEEIAKAIALDYEAVVGKKVASQFSLPDLVTTPANELPAQAQAKQLSLFDYVSGTSQRSWLDRIRPEKPRGGDNTPRDEVGKRIAADRRSKLEIDTELVRFEWDHVFRNTLTQWVQEKRWQFLDDSRLVALNTLLIDAKREVAALVGKRRIRA